MAKLLSLDRNSRLGLDLHGRSRKRLVLAVLLHTSQDHRLGCHSLPQLRVGESLELLVVPLAGSNGTALRVDEHGVILGTEEVGNRVAVLSGVKGDDTVDAALELVAAGEAEGVTDMDESTSLLRGDEAHLLGTTLAGRADLETPLLAEEEGEGADVSVLLVTDAAGASKVRGKVMHHGELRHVSMGIANCSDERRD